LYFFSLGFAFLSCVSLRGVVSLAIAVCLSILRGSKKVITGKKSQYPLKNPLNIVDFIEYIILP